MQVTQDVLSPRYQVGIGPSSIGDEHLGHVVELAKLPVHPTTGPLAPRGQQGRQYRQFGGHVQDDKPVMPAPTDLEPLRLHA